MNKKEQEEWDSQARRAVLRRKKYNKPWDVVDELEKHPDQYYVFLEGSQHEPS